MYLRHPLFRCLAVLLLMCTGHLYAQPGRALTRLDLRGEVRNLKVLPGMQENGLRGLEVQFDCSFSHGPEQLDKAAEDPRPPFMVIAWLQGADGYGINAMPDAGIWRSDQERAQDSLHFPLLAGKKVYLGMRLFLPYFALELAEGPHELKLVVELRDARSFRVLDKEIFGPFTLEKPAARQFRLQVEEISVAERDNKEEPWDFVFLNPKDAFPDIQWVLRRGGQALFTPDRQKNNLVYTGTKDDRSPLFTLSQGDKVEVFITDYDMLTFSDPIGVQELDLWSAAYASQEAVTYRFGWVRNLRVQATSFELPQLRITDLTVREQRFLEMPCIAVHFNYRTGRESPDLVYSFQLKQVNGDKPVDIPYLHLMPGAASWNAQKQIVLQPGSGEVLLYVPWFALKYLRTAQAPDLILYANVLFQGKSFVTGTLRRSPGLLNLADKGVRFHTPGSGETNYLGLTGQTLRISVSASPLLGQYLGQKQLYLKYAIGVDSLGRDSRHSTGSYLSPTGERLLQQEQDLNWFLPACLQNLPPGMHTLHLNLEAYARTGDSVLPLESFRQSFSMRIPEVYSFPLLVREAQPKSKVLYGKPDMFWRILHGNETVCTSDTVQNSRHGIWNGPPCILRAAGQDQITVELLQVIPDDSPHRVAIWKGTAEELRNLGTGRIPLNLPDIKRFVLELPAP